MVEPKADVRETVVAWKRRITALADAPNYVFRNTSKALIDEHYRRLTEFQGYTLSEIESAESRLGVRFPLVFRGYLLELAKSPGELFRGSDLASLTELEDFRAEASALMHETDATLALPREAVVFLMHQGYAFSYFLGTGGSDGPVFHWVEGERESEQIAPSFADLVNAMLDRMEDLAREWRARGGYYLTINPDGSTIEEHPALSSGDRPLLKPSWRFWR